MLLDAVMDLLDIKVDVVFKDFFGDRGSKDILESFINSVLDLQGDDVIEIEDFLDPRKMRVEVGKPTTFVDLSVKARGGERYIVEMQTYNHQGVDKRLLYYLGKDFTEQIEYSSQETKKEISWKDLPRVCVIAIMDYHRSKSKRDGVLNDRHPIETYRFLPQRSLANNHLFDHWQATLVDLKKFDKSLGELHSDRDRWLFLMKHASHLQQGDIEAFQREPIFDRALQRLAHLSSDPQKRRDYEASIDSQRDWNAVRMSDWAEGKEEGIEIGTKQGIEIGTKQGIEIGTKQGIEIGTKQGIEIGTKQGVEIGTKQGIEIGTKQGRDKLLKQVVCTMHQNGLTADQIAQATGVSLEEVESILREAP